MRARVSQGRLIIDEPFDLPEGTVLDLVVDDEGDELDEGERAALHAALERGMEDVRAGRVKPVADLLAELAERHGR